MRPKFVVRGAVRILQHATDIARLAIDLATMAHRDHLYHEYSVEHLVQHAVVTNANAVHAVLTR